MIFAGGVARMMRMPLNMTIDLATCFFAWATFLAADIAYVSDGAFEVYEGCIPFTVAETRDEPYPVALVAEAPDETILRVDLRVAQTGQARVVTTSSRPRPN